MVFKVFEIPVMQDGVALKLTSGRVKTRIICREGINGTGVSLPFTCGFCKDRGKPTAAFRSRKQRNAHANLCLK